MATTIAETSRHHQSSALAATRSTPIVFWAWVGGCLLLAELYIWASWIFGPNFQPTDPGPDPIPSLEMGYLYLIQTITVIGGVLAVWYWILKPSIKQGQVTTDAMLAICCWMIWIYDPSMNYTSVTVLYNSHAINMGAWTLGSWPGWTSPNGNLLPEPLLVTGPGYLCWVFLMVVFPCWIMKRVKARYPNLGFGTMLALLVLGVMVTDTLVEIFILRTGVYAYPYGIREITLFAGETYQFPLTEALTFGGAVSVIAVLKFFKDDKGQTFVERGSEKLRMGSVGKQWVKFLALFGCTHLGVILIFTIPNQWLGTHSDPFPEGYPSYMINNMCVYGDERNECPGPGVSIPRPQNNPF